MKDMSGVDILLKEIQGKDQDIGKVCFLTASNTSYEEITQTLTICSDLSDDNDDKKGKIKRNEISHTAKTNVNQTIKQHIAFYYFLMT